jgi:hypothetical protein
MGFYIRKAFNFGPLRMNLSKSGIGVSLGVKGARISTGPKGTYVHMGRYGLYYRQRIGGHRVKALHPDVHFNQQYENQEGSIGPHQQHEAREAPFQHDPYEIKTGDVTRLAEASNSVVLSQINNRKNQTPAAPLIGIGSGVLAYSALHFLGIINLAAVILGIGLVFTYLVHKGDEIKRTTPLFYEPDEDASKHFNTVQSVFQKLARAERIWRITSDQPTRDWKRQAGASHLVKRKLINVGRLTPSYIATNLDVWGIDCKGLKLFFFPDNIFVLQNGVYGAVSYDSLRISFGYAPYIEGEGVPEDSEIINYTWQYVNRNGGPDRRYKNNRQIPVVNYGLLEISSASGLNIYLYVSNHTLASDFANFFNSAKQQSFDEQGERKSGFKTKMKRTRREEVSRDKPPQPDVDSRYKSAYDILGIQIGASIDDINTAYRHMAQMYHPDKVAHLAPEFREIAEDRMKEINAAYEELKRQTSSEGVKQETSRIIVELG